jgi:Raf kinase inhibitor-like YbhB/YbcL family protein
MNTKIATNRDGQCLHPHLLNNRWLALAAFSFCVLVSGLTAARAEFKLTSKDLHDNGRMPEAQVFNDWGLKGGNQSPELSWSGAPEGTKSFVVTAYGPDAPTGSGFWHWVVINIPAGTAELPTGAGSGKALLPAPALQTRTDMGTPGYLGAAPPPGPAHRYIFTVYALKVEKLEANADTSAAMIGFMVHNNELARASLTVTYGR